MLLLLFFFDLRQQVLGENDNRPIRLANILQDHVIGRLVSYLKHRLIPQLIPPLLLQKVQRLIQQRPEHIRQVTLNRELVSVDVMILTIG